MTDIVSIITVEGVRFEPASSNELPDWHALRGTGSPLLAFAAQLDDMALLGYDGATAATLSWAALYDLIEEQPDGDPDFAQTVLAMLGLPSVEPGLRPKLSSTGSLTDRVLAVRTDGWLRADVPLPGRMKRTGAVLTLPDGSTRLATRELWTLMERIRTFNSGSTEDRSATATKLAWAELREAARSAGARLDGFLRDTIVIAPSQLQLMLARQETAGSPIIEVTPTFEGAPPRWVEMFERHGVKSSYRIPVGDEYYEVVFDDELLPVLEEIKRLPGRRVAGARAQRLIQNPIAYFGPAYAHVFDEEHVAEELAGIRSSAHALDVAVILDGGGAQQTVEVLLESLIDGNAKAIALSTEPDLARLVGILRRAIEEDASIEVWRGHDIAVDATTRRHLRTLEGVLDAWRRPTEDAVILEAASVLDVARYSDRVTEIGVETPWAIVTIPRASTADGWWDGDDGAPIRIALVDEEGTPTGEQFQCGPSDVRELVRNIDDATTQGAATVPVPGPARASIPIAAASSILDALPPDIVSAARRDGTSPPKTERTPARRAVSLLIASNVERNEYLERRAVVLAPPTVVRARLPVSLRSDVQLRQHQIEGVQWLQHLHDLGPDQCRGALLADDMGLGKTLQSLTFVAELFERDPTAAPALVVAPVSLLGNWAREVEHFFEPGAFRTATLYGADLKRWLRDRSSLSSDLRDMGIERLLVDGWRDGTNLVLTTYETLRDLQFSLAELDWSVVVCDEAQRIKNPNALISRAAKKLKTRFRVAATGTPVENTLQDLWSLFDFVQPGLLPPLAEFARRYRRPIEARSDGERERLDELRALLAPQILRRLKSDVARDLPEKVFDGEARSLDMSPAQEQSYRAAIDEVRMLEGVPGAALKTLQRLRRTCSQPYLPAEEPSPKLQWLLAALDAVRVDEEKALVFVEMLDVQRDLQTAVRERYGLIPDIINGSTAANPRSSTSRQRRIERFSQQMGFGVLILSPIAAGVGLNIQAANHVIHYMRHWNPAKEDQATDRAYRIGQTKKVTVYTPIVCGRGFVSFDERLDALLEEKRQLAQDMYNGSGGGDAAVDADFADLLG